MSHTSVFARALVLLLVLAALLSACGTAPVDFKLSVNELSAGNNLGFQVLGCPVRQLPQRQSWQLTMSPVFNNKWGDVMGRNSALLDNQLYVSQACYHYYDNTFAVPDTAEWWQDAAAYGAGCRLATAANVLQALDTWNTSAVGACPVQQLLFKLVVTTFDNSGQPSTTSPAYGSWNCPFNGGSGPASGNEPSGAALPNPASVYCLDQGYNLEMREGPGGQYGVCKFPNGTECEEWAYYRGECHGP